jgi:hypothetical protein
MLRRFAWVFFWRRHKKPLFDGAASPEKTGLMSFEDLSFYNDSYIYNSHSSDSGCAVAPCALETSFPYWEDRKMAYKEAVQKQSRALEALEMGCKKERNTRLRRTLMRVLNNARKCSMSTNDSPSGTEEEIEVDLNDSEHFSISTDTRQPAFHQVNISITTNDDQPQHTPPSDSSVVTSRSTLTTRDDKSRISLEQFMEERKHETSSFAGSINLGEIAANDSASACSGFLGVSFDEDYPQLVLQPSHDGSASRMTGSSTVHSNGTIGASYPHPAAASNRSVSSFDTTKKNTSCTPRWLNDNIDRVWKQIDQSRSDPDDRDDTNGVAHEDNGGDLQDAAEQHEDAGDSCKEIHGDNQGDKYGDTIIGDTHTDTIDGDPFDDIIDGAMYENKDKASPPVQPHTRPRYVRQDKFDWMEDVLWSFSTEESVKSLSTMIEKEVIDPILKPICHLVEATDIPEAPMCGQKGRRPPLNEKTFNTSSYRMSPRKSQKRVVKKV